MTKNTLIISSNKFINHYSIGYLFSYLSQLLTTKDELQGLNGVKTQSNIRNYVTNKGNIFLRRIHILSWIRDYDRNSAIADVIAGITLGLTIIPQSIAYALLAGLPSQYGLYAAFMGAFVYVIFGSIKEVSIGPTNLMALLILQYTFNKPPEFAVILAFLAGIVELIMGLLNIGGMIVDFCTEPVISAFTSATAIIVFISQAKNLLGVNIRAKEISSTIAQIIYKINEIRYQDAVLGISCIIILLLLKQLGQIKLDKSKTGLKKFLWYISISRNAICVLISSVLAYKLSSIYDASDLFRLSGNVEAGVPTLQLPPFEITYENITYNFMDIIKELGSGIIVVPLVAMLANVAIAKAFSTDGSLDASQELFALGLCNIFGSFFKGMPVCGAFTRSCVSNSSGVKTPMAGIYSGTMVILSLSLLTPYFKYIPRSTLAAVLVSAVVFMIDFKIVPKLYKESKTDFISWFVTFIVCIIFGVEIGLLIGILMGIIFLLKKLSRPKIISKILQVNTKEYLLFTSETDVFYTAIDHLRITINKACAATGYKLPVVLDCCKITQIDFTCIKSIKLLNEHLQSHNLILIIKDAKTELEKLLIQNNLDDIRFCQNTVTESDLKYYNDNNLYIVESSK